MYSMIPKKICENFLGVQAADKTQIEEGEPQKNQEESKEGGGDDLYTYSSADDGGCRRRKLHVEHLEGERIGRDRHRNRPGNRLARRDEALESGFLGSVTDPLTGNTDLSRSKG
ncbi:hypothetical protein U1Q18_033679 [Sarracenia purpurea var. burkii]